MPNYNSTLVEKGYNVIAYKTIIDNLILLHNHY